MRIPGTTLQVKPLQVMRIRLISNATLQIHLHFWRGRVRMVIDESQTRV